MSTPNTMTCPRCWGERRAFSGEPPNTQLYVPCRYCAGSGVAVDVQLSENFRLSEFLRSDTAVRRGIANDPTPAHAAALGLLCRELLEPMRREFGPLRITSGLRLPALNAAIGGSSSTSAHQLAHAADLVPVRAGVKLRQLVEFVRDCGLPFDQVIYEGTWVHVGRVSPAGTQRRQVLQMFPAAGRPVYSAFDPTDPRVNA